MKFVFIRMVGLCTLILFLAVTVQAQQLNAQPKPVVAKAVRQSVSPPLRDIKPQPPKPGAPREIPLLSPVLRTKPGIGTDPVVQEQAGNQPLPGPIQNFEGQSDADNEAVVGFRVAPPDTNGDVGPNHYVQWVNLVLAIYDKSGNLLLGPLPGNAPFQGLGGICEDTNNGDPIVLYDPLADRWMISQFAFADFGTGSFSGGYQCVAVSQTPDPTGAWNAYAFLISPTALNDYPKFGVWPDGYYASFNMFNGITGFFEGVVVAVFERDKMLAGQLANMVSFALAPSTNAASMLPADLDGPPPPLGASNYFAEIEPDEFGWPQDQLGIFAFHVDWPNPSNSTFSGIATLPTASFNPNVSRIPQKGVPKITSGLDALSDRLMYRLQYRNFGDHQSMVTNHTVNVGSIGSRAGVRWYELRDSGGGWGIFQQGTYAPGFLMHRWMGSIAMDGDGNIALGFSYSSVLSFPSICYTGREPGDALGTLREETILFVGTGSQQGSGGRWGDYSMMAVDPTDDHTFWYTQEYYATTSSFNWKTRIGSFAFPVVSVAPGVEPVGAKLFATPQTARPVRFALGQNYPNPFNPETWLPFELAADTNVSITIYDAAGHHIRNLNLGLQSAGAYLTKEKAAYWDGRSDTGELVSSGVYFYRLSAGDFQATKRMIILK
ncbi:T9SS type A sorting domain-containing protein [Candidatus Poribacteria bacterium]|nr:T9SS type A sorting domain-containing protein [Candidatus Poribacteria bacterium]